MGWMDGMSLRSMREAMDAAWRLGELNADRDFDV